MHESVNKEYLKKYTKEIMRLPREQLDELWYLCGFIISDHAKDLKALREEDIKNVKNNFSSAELVLSVLLTETSIIEFEENLKKVQKWLT